MNIEVIKPTDEFQAAIKEFGIAFDDGDIAQLGRYLAMLLDENTRFNLTAIKDPDTAWMKHIFDSLAFLAFIDADAKSVIDVGSGGGLPGIPLAIALPNINFTLLEATGKKAEFLGKVIEELSLNNVRIVNDRAETIGMDLDNHREQYDVVVSRALGKMAVLIELCTPLAKVGGYIIAMKGEKAQQEIDEAKTALHRLHCGVIDTHRTPTGTVVVIQKQRTTPKRYPRRPGEPKRAPL